MRRYFAAHRRMVGLVGVLVAVAVAVMYLNVTPAEASGASGMRALILLYGHAVCWLLLSVASGLWAIQKPTKWITAVAYVALAVYGIFIATLLTT